MADIDQRLPGIVEAEVQRMRDRVQQEASRQLADGYPNPADRYRNDVEFHSMVDMMRAMIRGARFTPTELREAAILAAIMEEERRAAATPIPGGG